MNGTSHFLKTKFHFSTVISFPGTRREKSGENDQRYQTGMFLKGLESAFICHGWVGQDLSVPSTVLRLKVDKGQGLRSGLLVSLFTFIILYITVNWWVDVFILIKFVNSLLTSLAGGKMLTVLQNKFLEN